MLAPSRRCQATFQTEILGRRRGGGAMRGADALLFLRILRFGKCLLQQGGGASAGRGHRSGDRNSINPCRHGRPLRCVAGDIRRSFVGPLAPVTADTPPSTASVCPVMCLPASDANSSAAPLQVFVVANAQQRRMLGDPSLPPAACIKPGHLARKKPEPALTRMP